MINRLPDKLLNELRQTFSGGMVLCNFGQFKLVSKISRQLLELGTTGARGLKLGQLLENDAQITSFLEIWPLQFGHFKLVSKIFRHIFELEA